MISKANSFAALMRNLKVIACPGAYPRSDSPFHFTIWSNESVTIVSQSEKLRPGRAAPPPPYRWLSATSTETWPAMDVCTLRRSLRMSRSSGCVAKLPDSLASNAAMRSLGHSA